VAVHLRSRDRARVERAAESVRRRLGDHVFSEDGRSLAEVVVRLLADREETVGTVESCTGGLLGGALTSVAGSSRVVRAGLVVYSNEAKTSLAGVPPGLIEVHGAVSPETARALAEHGRRAVRADWALGVTGIAGPGGGTPEKPVGTVYTAVAGPDGVVEAVLRRFPGPREHVRTLAVAAALEQLRRRLLA
jgi:nicotinamide-nucleotide amidase